MWCVLSRSQGLSGPSGPRGLPATRGLALSAHEGDSHARPVSVWLVLAHQPVLKPRLELSCWLREQPGWAPAQPLWCHALAIHRRAPHRAGVAGDILKKVASNNFLTEAPEAAISAPVLPTHSPAGLTRRVNLQRDLLPLLPPASPSPTVLRTIHVLVQPKGTEDSDYL